MTTRAASETLVAVLLAVALLLAVSAVSGDGPSREDARSSSFVKDLAGTRALYEILEGIGARPERLVRSPRALREPDRTVLVAAPSEPLLPQDVDDLLDWVATGGRLVVAAGLPRPPVGAVYHRALLDRIGLRSRPRPVLSESPAVIPGSGLDVGARLDWPVKAVLEFAPDTAKHDDRAGDLVRLVGTRSHLLVAAVPFGGAGGEVVAISDVSLLSNEILRRGDNVVLAASLLLARDGDGGRVVFDEFHHGFRPGGERSGLMRQAALMLLTTWPGRAVLLLIGAWIVLLFGRAPRLGAPLPEPPPPRRELSEHADALGRLLESARSRRATLQMLTEGTRRAVAGRSGIPAGLPAAEFRRRLANSPAAGARELADALERAETLDARRDSELARAARELAVARRTYIRGGGGRRHGGT